MLLVKCLGCQHELVIPAEALARRLDASAMVEPAVRRLRCSQCRQCKVDVLISGIPR